MVEVFTGGRLERKNLAALGVNAGHHMLDRAVLPRCVHCLKDQQHSPIVLGIKPVLKLGEHIDPHGKGFFGARFVL